MPDCPGVDYLPSPVSGKIPWTAPVIGDCMEDRVSDAVNSGLRSAIPSRDAEERHADMFAGGLPIYFQEAISRGHYSGKDKPDKALQTIDEAAERLREKRQIVESEHATYAI